MVYATNAIVAVVLAYTIQLLYTFTRNIINGRAVGLPMVVVPVDQTQLPWLLFAPSYSRWLQKTLPRQLWNRLSVTIFGWEFHEKLRPFEQFAMSQGNKKSKSFLLVGLSQLELWTADPIAVQDILTRYRDFEVPHAIEYALGQYGANVLTANGDRWARHRRIVSTVIDDRISKTVFQVSREKTQNLLDDLGLNSQSGQAETRYLFDKLKKITIHVLLSAAMGRQEAWQETDRPSLEPGFQMTQTESLITVVTSLVGLGILPTKILVSWPSWLPGHGKMTSIGSAKIEVQKRIRQVLNQERASQASMDLPGSGNHFLKKLLKASESDGGNEPLSEAEMISNVFIFTAAGFETTATVLAYAMVLLARHPLWQDWVLEEVDDLVSTEQAPHEMEYTSIFPRVTRIMAFMFETLRLFSPVCHVHRETATPQVLQTANGEVLVPANTRVYVNSVAVHLLPTWRDVNRGSDPAFYEPESPDIADESSFRPSRWLNPRDSAQRLYHPPKGTYVPWAMGPRVCPGQKMAQVEFTAVMLTLLRDHRIEAALLKGEGRREVEQRLDERLRDSHWVTVLQMNNVFEPKANEGLLMQVKRRK